MIYDFNGNERVSRVIICMLQMCIIYFDNIECGSHRETSSGKKNTSVIPGNIFVT